MKLASARYTLNIKHEENEPEKIYTKKEKFANFWHYHKYIILGAIAALILIVFFIVDVLSVVEPDYSIGLLNHSSLPTQAIEALEAQLELQVDDLNGDGVIEVFVNQYTLALPSTASSSEQLIDNSQANSNYVDPSVQMASVTKFLVDLQEGTSIIFLTNDVQSFEEQYGIFAYNDGSTPPEQAQINYDELGVLWQDSTTLSSFEGEFADTMQNTYSLQETFSDYTILLRSYHDTAIEKDDDMLPYYNANIDLFNKLIQ